MRKPLSVARLRDAVNVRISKVQESVDSFTGATNPQVRDMYLKAKGELEALELVRDAILQKTVFFLEH
jgi:hypothetical protein